jgi:hypothetical protein
MTRVRRVAKVRREPLSDAMRRHLLSGEYPTRGDFGSWVEVFDKSTDQRGRWQEHGDDLLAEWIADHPGTRPWAWWRFDAPEPRHRLGGVGTPSFEVLAHAPEYDHGLPTQWVTVWDVEYYTGRAVDVHGKAIGQEFRGRRFAGQAIDPDDPPRYESEAAYLDRHGLLSAEERAELSADAFEPEVIAAEDEDDE